MQNFSFQRKIMHFKILFNVSKNLSYHGQFGEIHSIVEAFFRREGIVTYGSKKSLRSP